MWARVDQMSSGVENVRRRRRRPEIERVHSPFLTALDLVDES